MKRLSLLIFIVGFFIPFFYADATQQYPVNYDPATVLSEARNPGFTVPVVVTHRGTWDDEIPENSELAFIRTNTSGTAIVETDVRLTSDKVPVLFHDSGLGRMTDVYKNAPPGEMVFDPMTGDGYNPKISDTSWSIVQNLYYLEHPSGKSTKYRIMSVKDFYDFYFKNRLNLTVFLEIKDPSSLPFLIKMLNADTRDYYYGAGGGITLKAKDFTVFKFNVNYYPMTSDYKKAFSDAGVPCCYYAMPSYKSNTYKDFDAKGVDMGQSVDSWSSSSEYYVSGIEVGLKTQGGILQDVYDSLLGKSTLGIFNAVPDFLLATPGYEPESLVPDIYSGATILAQDAFYDGTTGRCCYQLDDLLSSWGDKKDTQDQRSDPAYIVGDNPAFPAFRIVTTDKPDDMTAAFNQAGFPVNPGNFGVFPTFSDLPVYMPIY
ncbi:glycerophosphodiester phosphodiesterase family protein [Salmonella enterica]